MQPLTGNKQLTAVICRLRPQEGNSNCDEWHASDQCCEEPDREDA